VDGTSGRLCIGACLSLSGRFAPFGRQAARGLQAWAALDGDADLLIEDDGSDVRQLQAILPEVAARCDLLLGPYSTVLMRAAGDLAARNGWLIWNHGGSGDDVETAHPGHVISVPTPASRYMEPFLAHLAVQAEHSLELRIAHGKGRFGRQVAGGAERYAKQLGFAHVRRGPVDEILTDEVPDDWTLITAGTFEDDTQVVNRARHLSKPPLVTCAIAAGVREFGGAVQDPDGTFGIAQWFLGSNHAARVGPGERDFLDAFRKPAREAPGYPAVQAVAAASIAAHCARRASQPDWCRLWRAATELETCTLYGSFKIDKTTGAQVWHRTVLTCWIDDELTASEPSTSRAQNMLPPEVSGGYETGSQTVTPRRMR
jgi:Periplasmic binding protein